ncbi:hypothetical protein ABEB36_007319 [Hypothenemus hampei]|uniref:Acid phosphatase n=1 Tax=Hypothenemus hampei TaxID=57062 RepID=A0ABD1ETK3_HYPHA
MAPTINKKNKKCIIVIMASGVTVLLVLALIIGINLAKEPDKKELKLVHIIFRHGIRTPADTYPTDPHVNDTLYPVGWGQLTNEGKMEMYELGKFLRQRYDNFLGDFYHPNEFYSQSTGVDRTKASVQLVNVGIWPPKTKQIWGPLNWQPIPVHSELLSQDMLLLVRKPCAAYHKERDKVVASETVQKKFQENQALFNYLTQHTGRLVENFDDVQDIFSTLKAEMDYNLTLPSWTNECYPDKMLEATVFSYTLNAWNDKMNRLKGGVLLNKIINDWKSKVNERDLEHPQKAFLYGGHDSTIVNFMRTLKVWDTQFPNYGVTVLLEFSILDGEYGLEVYLRNSTSVPPFKLNIPGCNDFCPLTKLLEVTRNVVPINWEEECENDGSYEVPEPGGP